MSITEGKSYLKDLKERLDKPECFSERLCPGPNTLTWDLEICEREERGGWSGDPVFFCIFKILGIKQGCIPKTSPGSILKVCGGSSGGG